MEEIKQVKSDIHESEQVFKELWCQKSFQSWIGWHFSEDSRNPNYLQFKGYLQEYPFSNNQQLQFYVTEILKSEDELITGTKTNNSSMNTFDLKNIIKEATKLYDLFEKLKKLEKKESEILL